MFNNKMNAEEKFYLNNQAKILILKIVGKSVIFAKIKQLGLKQQKQTIIHKLNKYCNNYKLQE